MIRNRSAKVHSFSASSWSSTARRGIATLVLAFRPDGRPVRPRQQRSRPRGERAVEIASAQHRVTVRKSASTSASSRCTTVWPKWLRSRWTYWRHTHPTVDVVPGRGSGFSPEAPEGVRFLIRSRPLTDEELATLG